MSYLTEEEREEYEQLLKECCGDPGNGGKRISVIAARLQDGLRDAEQAGRAWATHILEEDQLAGHANRIKLWLKKESVVLVSHNGEIVGKATRVGRKSRNAEGEQVWTQTLFRDMSWDEVEQWLDGIRRQLTALGANVSMGNRLFELRSAVPDSFGPADAAASLGTTVDEWLAS